MGHFRTSATPEPASHDRPDNDNQADHAHRKSIRLEPLTDAHITDLDYACRDPADGRRTIWRYLLDARVYREGGMERIVKGLQL